ncbi:MAG: hypothetical protein NXH82_05590 [Rhodobacteraceae bacterium]|nr:hypothetical protein [Paracoccaceae bacterium]
MDIVLSTLIAVAAMAIIFVQGPHRGLWAFMGVVPLGAAAAINLPALGGATIGLKEACVFAVFTSCVARVGGFDRLVGALRPGLPGFALTIFILYCGLSALIAPAAFRGMTEIFSLSRDANASGIVVIPLHPTTGNITQMFSLVLGFLAYVCFAALFRKTPDAQPVVRAMIVLTLVHVGLGVLDVLTYATDTTRLMNPLRSANYAIYVDHKMIGVKRMIGGFPEASVFGAFSLALSAFWLQFWFAQPRSRVALILTLASVAVLLRSTSSSAYVSLVLFVVFFAGMQVWRRGGRQTTRRGLARALGIGLLIWLAAIFMIMAQQLLDPVQDFLNRAIFDKLDTASGVERMSWNGQAFKNFLDTYMLGAGLGSTRASNWLLASLSSVGLIGTAAYAVFLFGLWRLPAQHGDAQTSATIRALKAACGAMLLIDFLTAGTPNQGVFFFAMAGLAAGLSRGVMLHHRRMWLRQQAGTAQGGAVVTLAALIAVALAAPAPVRAQGWPENPVAPRLGVASNFGQGWQPDMLAAAERLGLKDFRDAVYWRDIETPMGTYEHLSERSLFPDRLAAFGAGMSLTVNNPHPAYDGGTTPYTDAGIDGFARFAVATLDRFPAIHSVEVGNEMNSATFASGPGWDGPLETRAATYARLLKETARQIRGAAPQTPVLGGAAVSVPLAWVQALSRQGAMAHMDAFVIHPYYTAPEQLRRQVDLIRAVPGMARMPLEVTEFGLEDPGLAPAHLLKSYCEMALSGVTRAVWYPLNPRGDGWTPLLAADGTLTDVGRGFVDVVAELPGLPVRAIRPDPFTYGCRFGDTMLVIWGAPRDLRLTAPGLSAFDATGRAIASDGLRLSRAHPVVIRAATGAALDRQPDLGEQRVIADSFDQFAYPGSGRASPFAWLLQRGLRLRPMQMRPGQEREGVPWTPYLASDLDSLARADSEFVVPAGNAARPVTPVLRYTSPVTAAQTIVISAAPQHPDSDGIDIRLKHRLRVVAQRRVTGPTEWVLGPVDLAAGETVDFVIGPGPTSNRDLTRLRVTISHAD